MWSVAECREDWPGICRSDQLVGNHDAQDRDAFASCRFICNGNVFAADFYNHRVQKFNPDGAFLAAFGDKGEGPGRLTYAMGVAVAADGSVFVTDFGNHRVTRWRPGKTGG